MGYQKEVNRKNYRNKYISLEGALLFFTGFLGLSALSNKVTSMIGIPYLIELYFVPFVMFYNKKIVFKKHQKYNMSLLDRIGFYYILMIVFFSTILGIINTGDLYNVITLIRPLIYIILIVYYFANKEHKIDIYKVYILVFGALMGELFNKFFVLSSFSHIDHINVQALSVFIIIPFIKRNRKLILFSVIFGVFMGTATLYRRIFLTSIIAVISGLSYYIFKERPLRIPIYIASIGLISGILYKNYERIMMKIIEIFKLDDVPNYYLSGSYRLIEKFKIKDNASDNVRRSVLNEIFTKFDEKIIPPGPVGKAYGLNYFGAYTDATNVYMYDIFGSILSWIVVVIVALKALKSYLNIYIKNIADEEYILSALMVPIFVVSMVFDGTFLVHANISIIAAYAMHGWFKRRTKI